ncbi:MAG TPA: SIS domain-containing protein [Solirubrobacterales bacterium]|nr:SIS domain-containing protein [Solirubrobacterales bacterium]
MSTVLEQEIRQQGEVLRRREALGVESATRAAAVLSRADVDHLLIAARGSSDNAARFAQYLFGRELRLETSLAAPWLFRDRDAAPRLPSAAVLGISQSGMSPDVVGVLAAARAEGRPTIAITADPASPLALEADVVVELLCGEERSVAATKTYLASLHALLQIAEALAPDRRRSTWLARLPDLVDAQVASMLVTRERFDPLGSLPLITVTGRGAALSSAFESALKIRELSGTPAEAFSPPDLLHGPIAALDGSGGAWLVEPEAGQLEIMRERAAVTVAVGAAPPAGPRTIDIPLPASAPDWARAVLAVIPAQAAGLRLAEVRGGDVDAPAGLSKVTQTR